MKSVRQSTSRRWVGLVLALLGVIGAIYFGAAARHVALHGAVRQAVSDLTPTLGVTGQADPQVVVHRLVTTKASEMAFLTVRNANGRLVASDGAWSSWFAGMASRATVRTWRAWMYRTLCAETYRSMPDGVALHVGVPWWRVLAHAGPAFWLALLLTFLGLALFERDRRRPREPQSRPSEPATAGTVSARRGLSWSSPSPTWRAPLQRIRYVVGRRDRAGASADTVPAAGFEPIGRHGGPRPSEPTASTPPVETGALPDRPATSADTLAEADAVSSQSDAEAFPPEASEPTSAPATFDHFHLRFQPIWRGAMDGLLAGAAVRLLRAGESEDRTLDLAALMAAGAAPPERLVTWLMRRLVTLQANWRTVELPRVPLMLPLPASLFAFEGARDVWGDALSHPEPAAGELVFCVEQRPDWDGGALPVRWAVAEPRERSDATIYRLISGPPAEPAAEVEETPRFTLPDDPAAQGAQRPLSPRTFARLMSRSELAPF